MEDVPISVWPQWLAARSAVFHPDRGSAEGRWQVFYSRPLFRWIKGTPMAADPRQPRVTTHMRVEWFAQCPCKFS